MVTVTSTEQLLTRPDIKMFSSLPSVLAVPSVAGWFQ